MCIFEYPIGCNLIMDTLTKFESIKQKKENPKIFNTIIEYTVEIVESRGAFGSMVGAKKIPQYEDNSNNIESSTMDYVVCSINIYIYICNSINLYIYINKYILLIFICIKLYVFIFFNTILDQISNLDVRIHIRNQMMSCGMTNIIKVSIIILYIKIIII